MCDAHVARLILQLTQRTVALPLDWEMPPVAETLHSGLSALDVLASRSRVWLRCVECGGVWLPNLRRGGGLPRGSWKCPHYRCNQS